MGGQNAFGTGLLDSDLGPVDGGANAHLWRCFIGLAERRLTIAMHRAQGAATVATTRPAGEEGCRQQVGWRGEKKS